MPEDPQLLDGSFFDRESLQKMEIQSKIIRNRLKIAENTLKSRLKILFESYMSP